jgi:hypothetical protein
MSCISKKVIDLREEKRNVFIGVVISKSSLNSKLNLTPHILLYIIRTSLKPNAIKTFSKSVKKASKLQVYLLREGKFIGNQQKNWKFLELSVHLQSCSRKRIPLLIPVNSSNSLNSQKKVTHIFLF